MQPAVTSRARSNAGRPRDPSCDAAILRATVDAFIDGGYAGVSMEGVAARAGVGKATVYRRFPGKAELVVEAVRCEAQIGDDLPDTGDLRADLLSMLQPLFDRLRGPQSELLVRFATERVRNPELAAAFDRTVVGRKREHLRTLLARAAQRGELPPETDLELLAEAGPALLWHHALYGLPLDDHLLERIVYLILP